ncbi:SIR2 family protein [Listeria welshimeri]|uniref:SIR2 family protein n=1 Tax=Listeria welshimeri TaxID=1643 RepID=UPI001887030F|nr:SIR2 family protein [Listeria welshimeri]MBF2462731.1 SIR2 family protein [Listeria welshimeri]
MDKEKECDRTEILYHFQGDKNILANEDNIEIQKQQISSFIKREILNKNRNLNIFIGSGCSTPAIPLMGTTLKTILNKSENEDIKQEFISYLNLSEDHKKIFEKHLNEPLTKNDLIIAKNYDNFSNIEAFMTYIQQKINIERDEVHKNNLNQIFDSTKKQFVATIPKHSDQKYEGDVAKLYKKFYQKIFEKRQYESSKLNVFTTNYDLFNEIAFESNNINYSTGFTNNLTSVFNINQFNYRLVDERNRYKEKWQPTTKEANLYKLHGSINWIEKNKQIVQTNELDDKVIIYPTILKHQETTQSPYSELFRELSIQLQKTNSTLVTIGYSFGDDHINNIIFQNLINQDFTLIAFADVTEDKCMSIKKKHLANQNLHIIGGDIKNEEDINKAHYFNCILKNFMELEGDIDE